MLPEECSSLDVVPADLDVVIGSEQYLISYFCGPDSYCRDLSMIPFDFDLGGNVAFD